MNNKSNHNENNQPILVFHCPHHVGTCNIDQREHIDISKVWEDWYLLTSETKKQYYWFTMKSKQTILNCPCETLNGK